MTEWTPTTSFMDDALTAPYPWHCLSIFCSSLFIPMKLILINTQMCVSVSLSNGMSYGLTRWEWIYIFTRNIVDKRHCCEERSKKWEKYYSYFDKFWTLSLFLRIYVEIAIESQHFLPIILLLFSFFYPHVPTDVFICNDFKIFIFLLFDWSRRRQI